MVALDHAARSQATRCESCSSLVIPDRAKADDKITEMMVKDSFNELEQSAARGCDLCRLFRYELICEATDPLELYNYEGPVYFDADFKGRSIGYYLRCCDLEVQLITFNCTLEEFRNEGKYNIF